MNDDVKKAVEWLRTLDVDDRDYGDAQTLLSHIDGEPARLAAAREEQREADARAFEASVPGGPTITNGYARKCRATPLTATPLADENKALREDLEHERKTNARLLAERDEALKAAEQAWHVETMSRERREAIQRAESAEAIRDAALTQRDTALARVRELEAEVEVAWSDCEPTKPGPYGTVYVHDGCGACARCVDAARAERDDLKARLEELAGPVCTDAECPDHDGEHPYHFNAVALFWRRVEDTYENRNALCESAPVPPVQAWREERDALKARVAELEEGNVRRQVALEAERDELRQRILDSCPSPDEGGRIHAGGRIVCGQCHDSEVSHLRAQLAEAVGVLRALLREEWHTYEGNLEASGHASVDDLNAARAFLAKVKL